MFTAAQKLACVLREIGFRRRVYSRWVASGRMKQEKADIEIEMMIEIAKDYEAQLEGERLL